MRSPAGPRLCPSADPRAEDARVFGVIRRADGAAPHVVYLDAPAPATPQVLGLAGAAPPAEIFRATAPCVESRCGHFDGHTCRLGARVTAAVVPADDAIPPCAIRAHCRWFAEQGVDVCRRCAWVVTETPDIGAPLDALRWVADPASRL